MSDGFLSRMFALALNPILRWLETIFGLRTGPPRLERNLRVYVKTPTQRTIPLELQLDWTVEDIKEQLRAILDIKDNDLGIILAGRELADDVRLGNCDLSNMTIIHAVQVVHKPKHQALNEDLVDLQITGNDRHDPPDKAKKAHFFVYCKHEQSNFQIGKLRVRCYSCQEGSILIERDPCGWEDVLSSSRIRGHCLSGKCSPDATTPVEFYFKCNDPESSQTHEAPPLYQIRVNVMNVPCLACAECEDTVLVFDCQDRHVICLECFTVYVKSRLNERQFTYVDDKMGYTLGCPVNCQNSLLAEHKHLLAVLDRDDYERYQRFAAEECVLQAGGVLCPHPRCGTGIIPDDPNERKVKCQQCQFVFCKDCHQGFHIGPCLPNSTSPSESQVLRSEHAFDPEMISRARWRQDQSADNSSLLAIKVMTKPCPKCRIPTERDGGCMHMECTRCQYQWCWICQTNWSRDCMASHWFS